MTDPRSRSDGLGWVTRALFGDDRLVVTTAPSPPSPSHSDSTTVLARYVVVPSLDAARFLLPLAPWPVRRAALLDYNRLRAPAVRRRRALLAAAVRVHPTMFGRMPVLTVAAAAGVAATDVLLDAHVSAALGVRAVAAIGVHPPDPNAKPTLQLIGESGRPCAYVKVGWNDASRALVATEAAALRTMPTGPGHPIAPALLGTGSFGAQDYVAAAPLPADVRTVRPDDPAEVAAVLAVARAGGAPAARTPLAASPLAARLTGELSAVLARHSAVELEFGRWHGDWVPWNLARSRAGLVAFDWEHCGPGMPVGSDLAHQGFQIALILQGQDAAQAARAAEALVAGHARELGLGPDEVRATTDCYLAAMWLRTQRLAAGGAGWNPRLHPALLDVLRARLG